MKKDLDSFSVKKLKCLITTAIAFALFVGGCATNWNAQIGKSTYDQVAQKWGKQKPESERTLPNGDLEVVWFDVVASDQQLSTSSGSVPAETGSRETFIFGPDKVLKSHQHKYPALRIKPK